MTDTTTDLQTWTFPSKHPTVPGPWVDEPDKAQWIDEATGLDCLIVRGPVGALCGYVGVPPQHPWHGKGYSECLAGCPEDAYCYEHSPDHGVQVHGGLTFAASCSEGDPVEGICHVPAPGRPDDVWWFGFDCAHAGDLSPSDVQRAVEKPYYPWLPLMGEYRDVEYVRAECTDLARQIADRAA